MKQNKLRAGDMGDRTQHPERVITETHDPHLRTGGMRYLVMMAAVLLFMSAPLAVAESQEDENADAGRTLYVRQTTGQDSNDGLTPEQAWRSLRKLSTSLQAGDTVYIGPGLYREGIYMKAAGTSASPITLIADATGQHTGDPPGVVLLTGAEPVDESIFTPSSLPSVFQAAFTEFVVSGVVEMEGEQYRYQEAIRTAEHRAEGQAPLEIVSNRPASYHYDRSEKILYLHTSDGKPPTMHEMEVMRRGQGVALSGNPFVTVVGFTFRHYSDAGITFSRGSHHGVALNNVSYGSRIGIRVRKGSSEVLIHGNVLFRNENSGVYFLESSTGGITTNNIAYENIKGLRWGSESNFGKAFGNILFDNHEAGLALEYTRGGILRGNVMAGNERTQLFITFSQFDSEENCFDATDEDSAIAEDYPIKFYASLEDYRAAFGQDSYSKLGCGPLPVKVDVQKLHRDSLEYPGSAVQEIESVPES